MKENLGIKKCSKCKRELPANKDYFYSDKSKVDGLHYSCRECTGGKFKNSNKIAKDNYKICSKCKLELELNSKNFSKDKSRKDGHRCVCKDCESVEHAKYILNNKDKIKKQNKEYYKNNPMHRQISKQKRRALQHNAINDLTLQEWEECLKYFDYKDAYTGLEMDIVSQDHIVPLTKGGGYTIDNIIPCERSINSSKKNKNMEIWYKKQLFFSEERLAKIYEWQNISRLRRITDKDLREVG